MEFWKKWRARKYVHQLIIGDDGASSSAQWGKIIFERLIWTTKPKLDQKGNYFFHEYISFPELLVSSQEDEIVKYKYLV